jgi:hypothetical protein
MTRGALGGPAPEPQQRSRLRAKAQHRALSRLQAMHPDDYAALYEEEKAKAYAEAGFPTRLRMSAR